MANLQSSNDFPGLIAAPGTALAQAGEMSVQSSVVPLAAVERLPTPALARWKPVAQCPCCGSDGCITRGALPDRWYLFGTERIAYPEQGIEIAGCEHCGLHYKRTVPAPSFLAEIFARQAQAKWTSAHDFLAEAALLRQLRGGRSFDLLDVGAAGGELLAACGRFDPTKRRSALDVVRFPGIERHLAGEFMEGFLDDPLPAWSNEPYDVVTLFDVLEHLYEPQLAFANLRSLLCKDGLVFIETGNNASFWPRRVGIHQWWYVRLLEHHVFWSRRSLERIAATHGFRIVYWREVRHKSRRRLVPAGAMIDLLKTGLYLVGYPHYAAIAQRFGRQGNQPWFPFAVDHFQACLIKE